MDENDVYQYVALVKDCDDPESEGQKILYLTVNVEDANTQNEDEQGFDGVPDVKIITLEDGRVFLADPGDTFESVDLKPENESLLNSEPVLVTSLNIPESDGDEAEGVDVVKVIGEPYEMVMYEDSEPSSYIVEQKKSYKCLFDGCEKSYQSSHHLNVHMRNHMESKPYSCTVEGCEKTFATNYSLKAHLRIHTGEKPYPCPTCGKCFKTSGDLQKHYRIHTGEKPFLCPVVGCGKSFTTSNIRKVHIRSHTGERPYACDYPNCGKAFSSSTNFKNHSRIHSGEKPYACNVAGCDRRFTEYSSLYKHSVVHRVDRPFECSFCVQKFKSESALNLHKRVKHNIVISPDGSEIVVDILSS